MKKHTGFLAVILGALIVIVLAVVFGGGEVKNVGEVAEEQRQEESVELDNNAVIVDEGESTGELVKIVEASVEGNLIVSFTVDVLGDVENHSVAVIDADGVYHYGELSFNGEAVNHISESGEYVLSIEPEGEVNVAYLTIVNPDEPQNNVRTTISN